MADVFGWAAMGTRRKPLQGNGSRLERTRGAGADNGCFPTGHSVNTVCEDFPMFTQEPVIGGPNYPVAAAPRA
jgi:hypothetical protein